jgi:hypothetical protein
VAYERHSGNAKKPKSVRELAGHAISKDRDDIGTGVEYVSRIRKYRRETRQK